MGTNCRILLCLLALATQSLALLTSPPRMVKQPVSDEMLFQVAQDKEQPKPFMIECEAEGEPAPTYKWIKNGKPFQYSVYSNRMSQRPGTGTLMVSEPRDEDLGQYQCLASNEWGTAISNSVFLRKAELNIFNETEPKELEAQEGYPYKLNCNPPDGWPKPNVYWMLEGEQGEIKTVNNSRMTLDPEGNLWFSNVTREDASVDSFYTCAVKSVFRKQYQMGDKVFLKVKQTGIAPGSNKHRPEKQYVTRRNEVALRGKKVELFCIFGGTPLPQVVWKKDGQTILSSQRITQGNYGKTLVIKRAQPEDQGTYTCEVSNGVGSAQSYSINLKIQATPYFIEEPQFINQAEGETAEIRCTAGGTPEPQIQWIHNGQPIEQAPSNQRRQVTANSIIITDLVKNDTGNYGCNATNSLGYVYKDVYINVQAIPPEIKERPEDLVKATDSEVVMTCRVFGAPKPIVKWIRDGVELTGGKYQITPEGDLIISKVSHTDVGTYECLAENKFGKDSASGSLTVKKKTVITDKPEHYEVAAGSSATFRCNAHADESLKLNIIWLCDGLPIDFDNQPRFKMTNDYSLLISDTSELDSNEYTCVAKTEIDEARAQATLTVQDRPNAPKMMGITCQSLTATINWEPMGDNRAPIIRYSIHYNTSFTPDTWELASRDPSSTDKSWQVALQPWANYTFRVVAWNKIGPSAPSAHSDVCSTQPDVPYENPENVEGKGTEPNNMVISWTPMPQIKHHAPEFHYIVKYRLDTPGANVTTVTLRDWQLSQFTVNNTPTFKPYKIKVTAANSLGQANAAAPEVVGWSGEDVPLDSPRNLSLVTVTGPRTALVAWSPVTRESLRGHFKGYKIQIWTDQGGEDDMREVSVANDAEKALVENLIPNTINKLRIFAYNGRHKGPASEILVIETPEGPPGPVRTFEAYPLGSSALFLKWDKPESENGILTGYKIEFQKMTGTEAGKIQERKRQIDPEFNRAKLAGLEPDTKYRVTIRAKTGAGEGEPQWVEQRTNSIRIASAPDVPEFEATLLPTQKGEAHVLVKWIPSLDGHAGTHFVVSYRLKGAAMWETTPAITDEDFTVVKGLKPSQRYEMMISAYDGDYFRNSDVVVIDTTVDGPVVMRSDPMAAAGWFIGVMVALALLLLLLVCVCVARRNRGGKYDVRDRELQHGHRDLPDSAAFREYAHPLDSKSRHSMSSGKQHGAGAESDTDSMAEFVEGETAGMNEDGSFIGQYGRKRRPPTTGQQDSASQAFATLV